jgi:hypothetical protein
MKKSTFAALLAVVLVTWGSSVATRGNSAVDEGVALGGRNLAWCLRGIRWWALGHATDNDMLEVAGGAIAYLECR